MNENIHAPQLNREIATTLDGRDITRGYVGPLLLPYDTVLRERGMNDLLIYESVLSEPQVAATLQQRRMAVIQCETIVQPGGTKRIDKLAADFLKEQLQTIGWDRVTNLMLYGVFYGYSVSECIYSNDGQHVALSAIKVRNRRRFRYAPEGALKMLTPENMLQGVDAPAPYFWNFCTGADHDDEPYGLGLAHWLYWPVLFKRNGLKFWLTFIEKFGMPTAVGQYDPSATIGERQQLLAATRAIQTDAGIIMPTGMKLELLEAARPGTGTYDTLHDRMDTTIAKVVLGQTSTSEAKGGQYKSEIQMDVRQDLVKADADLICESFNLGPAKWLTEWNFPGAAIPKVSRDIQEPEDLVARSARDATLTSMGFKPSLAYITETYGGEWVESQQAASVPAVSAIRAGSAEVSHSFAEGDPQQLDPPDLMAGALDAQLAPATGAWIDRIKQLVDASASLEQVRDGLAALAPDMSLDDYTAAMRQALAAAALAGRYEILREAGA
jgi:phage gp29-like protein